MDYRRETVRTAVRRSAYGSAPMPRSRTELTAGEWAVLALLAEGPNHGFALARVMAPEGDVGRVWSVRRPLVYRAAETLARLELVRPTGTEASRTGPQRTVLAATPNGKRAVTRWLRTPVEHVRDGRSLLMLKLLFLDRRGADPTPLLTAQRDVFARQAARLARAADAAEGFDRALARWRLETTNAAARFVETMLGQPVPAAHAPSPARIARPVARQ
jgi:DNA-binding PadR family transcriptional regulator